MQSAQRWRPNLVLPVRLLIATPVRGADPFTAHVTVGYSDYVRRLSMLYPVEQFPVTVNFSSDTFRARNRIAAMVLRDAPNVTHVLWLDDDTWAEDVYLVQRMIDVGVDLIGAPYTRKREPVRWVHLGMDPPTKAPPSVELVEARGLGFGFTLTTRICLEKMHGAVEWADGLYDDVPSPHRISNMFGSLYDRVDGKKILLSEDFSFCKRWRDMGEQCWIYCGPGNIVNHAGARNWSARDIPGSVT
jgi:hypothetical protein